jgi:predicted nucleic acid-binding protein
VRAALVARSRAEGKAIAPADGYIAATAMTHGLIVATRNSAPFEAAGLTVINPWKTQHRRD